MAETPSPRNPQRPQPTANDEAATLAKCYALLVRLARQKREQPPQEPDQINEGEVAE